jgi:hypothetical protein
VKEVTRRVTRVTVNEREKNVMWELNGTIVVVLGETEDTDDAEEMQEEKGREMQDERREKRETGSDPLWYLYSLHLI